MKNYNRLLWMIVTSTAGMYGLMYLNVYEWDHVYFSQTRLYMSLLMGAAMTIVMLTFMTKMYTDMKRNSIIVICSLFIFLSSLWLVRSQSTVDDISWMKAMIPHHSIAILTSERARISDPRVRKLADGIIATQRREIDEMKYLLSELDPNH